MPVAASETADPRWRGLYIAGGVAALIAAAVFRRHFGVEVMVLMDMGIVGLEPPSSALDWFTLLQDNVLLGLILLDLFDIVEYALVGLMFLALYGALRRANKSAMTVALACDLVGIAVYLASNQAFAMLALSDQYTTVSTEAQQATFLAAGEALLAIHNPGGIHLSLLLVALAGLIVSLVMLRSHVFGKAAAVAGIAANSLVLSYFVAVAFAPAIAFLLPAISAPFRLIWYILIAWRLFQLGRGTPEMQA
jgi:hypothetical protein